MWAKFLEFQMSEVSYMLKKNKKQFGRAKRAENLKKMPFLHKV